MTKEQLRAYRGIKLERDNLEKMIATFERILRDPRNKPLSGMPKGKTGQSGQPESAAVKHEAVLARYRQKLDELAQALKDIEDVIEGLEPRERTLIRLYYAEGLTWEKVCHAMSYEWAQVHRIHSQALEKLKDV